LQYDPRSLLQQCDPTMDSVHAVTTICSITLVHTVAIMCSNSVMTDVTGRQT
jgi:hypothetical protein